MPKVSGAHHTGLTVVDLERSLAFYRDLLGLEEVFAWNPTASYIGELVGYPEVDLHAVVLRVPGTETFLELLEYRGVDSSPVDGANANPGTAHLAFFVADLDSVFGCLIAAGVKSVSDPITPTMGPNEGGRAVYMIDPDGVRVELIQTVRTFAQYAAVEPPLTDFLVTIENGYPLDEDQAARSLLLAAEAHRAKELAAAGILQRLWRQPGRRSNVGIWRAKDADELHEALSSLPFFPWLDIDIKPLSQHPSDPKKG